MDSFCSRTTSIHCLDNNLRRRKKLLMHLVSQAGCKIGLTSDRKFTEVYTSIIKENILENDKVPNFQ